MKRYKMILLTTAMVLMMGATGAAFATDTNNYGAAGAAADNSYTLEEMLTYAIQDEYMAQAEYQAIMAKYGQVRPYTNITRSETSHIASLSTLFNTYNIALPVNDAASRVVLPSTLQASYTTGVQAEIANIAMYKSFLSQDLPADVELTFTKLLRASENHLKAYENKAAGNTGNQMRNGKGFGGRR